MRISLKTELKLNNYQRTQLAKHAGVTRHAWNWGLNLCKMILDRNLDRPEEKLKFPSAIDLHKLKVIGSKNRHKANQKLAKQHAKVANIRQDTLHKLTTHLAKNHGQVVIEELNVSGLMAERKLAKSIADLGMYEFRRQLTYKCELYGSKLITVNRFYPSSKTCSCCGHIQEMPLKERVFNCLSCSTSIERDLNAALNKRTSSFYTGLKVYGVQLAP
jgi:IS605 OrfB family transposase